MKAQFVSVILFLISHVVAGQAGVGIGVQTPAASAALHIQAPGTLKKGLLIPRYNTTDRNEIEGPAEGLLVYDTDFNALFHYNNGWQQVGVPRGAIIMWSGAIANIPAGWALCDGGGAPARPNLSGRFIVGFDPAITDYNAPGKTGGASAQVLVQQNLPAHAHTIDHTHNFDVLSAISGKHFHTMTLHDNNGGDGFRVRSGGASNPRATYLGWAESQTTTGSNAVTRVDDPDEAFPGHADGPNGIETADIKPGGNHQHRVAGVTGSASSTNSGSTGAGSSFDNRPAYYVLAFIIKL